MLDPGRAAKVWLIDGVFFQAADEINVIFPPGHPVAMNPSDRFPFLYSGFVGRDATCVIDTLAGTMIDDFGVSELFEVVLNEKSGRLAFTKRYVGRKDPIFYEFTRRIDGLWVGRYSGENLPSGGGYTHCLVREAPPGFFCWPT